MAIELGVVVGGQVVDDEIVDGERVCRWRDRGSTGRPRTVEGAVEWGNLSVMAE